MSSPNCVRLVAVSLVVALTVSLLALPRSEADSSPSPTEAKPGKLIRLQAATFDPLSSQPEVPAALSMNDPPGSAKGAYLVQARGKVTEEWKEELLSEGAEIVSYIPDDSLLIRADKSARDSVGSLDSVRWMGPFHPMYKMSPSLSKMSGTASVAIHHFTFGTNGPTVRLLRANGAEIGSLSSSDEVNVVSATVDIALLDDIASLSDVLWIGEEVAMRPMNLDSSQLLQSGSTTGGRPVHSKGINGGGYIAAVADSGIRTTHEAFSGSGKVVANYVPPNGGGALGGLETQEHGCHVACTVAGDKSNNGIADGTADGNAPGGRIIFQDVGDPAQPDYIFPPDDLYGDLFQVAKYGGLDDGGATVPGALWRIAWLGGVLRDTTRIPS